MLFFLESLSMSQKSVHLQCVFHSIRFKVNKGWSTAVLLFLCHKLSFGTKVGAYPLAASSITLEKYLRMLISVCLSC